MRCLTPIPGRANASDPGWSLQSRRSRGLRPLVVDDQPDRSVDERRKRLNELHRQAEGVGGAMPRAPPREVALYRRTVFAGRLGDGPDQLNAGRSVALKPLVRRRPADDRTKDDGKHQNSGKEFTSFEEERRRTFPAAPDNLGRRGDTTAPHQRTAGAGEHAERLISDRRPNHVTLYTCPGGRLECVIYSRCRLGPPRRTAPASESGGAATRMSSQHDWARLTAAAKARSSIGLRFEETEWLDIALPCIL